MGIHTCSVLQHPQKVTASNTIVPGRSLLVRQGHALPDSNDHTCPGAGLLYDPEVHTTCGSLYNRCQKNTLGNA